MQRQNVKSLAVTEQTSLTVVKQLISTSVSCITYIRGLFPEENYELLEYSDMALKMLKRDYSEENNRLLNILEYGVFDAIEKRYLRTLEIGVLRDPQAGPDDMVESYRFSVKYPFLDKENQAPEASLEMSVNHHKKGSKQHVSLPSVTSASPAANTVGNVKRQTLQMIRALVLMLQTLSDLPDSCFLTMEIEYYDDYTPRNYEPRFFGTHVGNNKLRFREPVKVNVRVGDIKSEYHHLDFELSSTVDELSNNSQPIKSITPSTVPITEQPSLTDKVSEHQQATVKEIIEVVEPDDATMQGDLVQQLASTTLAPSHLNDIERADSGTSVSSISDTEEEEEVHPIPSAVPARRNRRNTINESQKSNVSATQCSDLQTSMPLEKSPAKPRAKVNSKLNNKLQETTSNDKKSIDEDMKHTSASKNSKSNKGNTVEMNDIIREEKRPETKKSNDKVKVVEKKDDAHVSDVDMNDIPDVVSPKVNETAKTDIIRCMCNSDTEDSGMVQCDKCEAWSHVVCHGYYHPKDERLRDHHFLCHLCDKTIQKQDSEALKDLAVFRTVISIVWQKAGETCSERTLMNEIGKSMGQTMTVKDARDFIFRLACENIAQLKYSAVKVGLRPRNYKFLVTKDVAAKTAIRRFFTQDLDVALGKKLDPPRSASTAVSVSDHLTTTDLTHDKPTSHDTLSSQKQKGRSMTSDAASQVSLQSQATQPLQQQALPMRQPSDKSIVSTLQPPISSIGSERKRSRTIHDTTEVTNTSRLVKRSRVVNPIPVL